MRHVHSLAVSAALFQACVSQAKPIPSADLESPSYYPFWLAAHLRKDGGPRIPDKNTPPAGAAFIIADGYLVAPLDPDIVGDDLSADQEVFVKFFHSWHFGRVVDFDRRRGLMLIRSDDIRPPVELGGGPASYVAGLMPSDDGKNRRYRMYRSPAVFCSLGEAARPRCYFKKMRALKGMLFLDGAGRVVGMHTTSYKGEDFLLGPDAAGIRAFVRTYFRSWGRYVEPKPEL